MAKPPPKRPITEPGDPEVFLSEVTADAIEVPVNSLDTDEVTLMVEAGLTLAEEESRRRVWFKFPMATAPAPGEPPARTPFPLVGRLLQQQLKAGRIKRAMPASEGGWIAILDVEAEC